jgi:hypothetical protein
MAGRDLPNKSVFYLHWIDRYWFIAGEITPINSILAVTRIFVNQSEFMDPFVITTDVGQSGHGDTAQQVLKTAQVLVQQAPISGTAIQLPKTIAGSQRETPRSQ